ncbi:hypothetical protein ACHAWF_018780 [Thalassiosira exigua]
MISTILVLATSLISQTHGFSAIGTSHAPFAVRTIHVKDHSVVSRFHRSESHAKLCSLLTDDSEDGSSDASTASPIQILFDSISSNPNRSIYFSSLMALCGAALGPFLDSYHSLFGVLTYDTPLVYPLLGSMGEGPALLTCVTTYWVPPLFGIAGFLIGWLYIWLDALFQEGGDSNQALVQLHPTIPKVLIGISYFTFQYFLSGILFANQMDRTSIFLIMSTLAAGGFYALDGTLAGLITSVATAVGGPLIEVGLISSLPAPWGYHYNDPGETGFFPLWIVPVYFLGGPANGNLARAFWVALGEGSTSLTGQRKEILSNSQQRVPCNECHGTRAVPCPNCDDGTYVSYGQRVICSACRGKGRVICRSCFSEYDDDPNDIENIRRIMDRIPD